MAEFDVQDGMTVRDYLRILRRNWGIILAATTLGVAGAGAFSALSVPQYQASTQLYVSVRSTGVDGALSDLTQGGTYARQAVLSYVDVVTSASVLGAVIEDLGLDLQIPELRDMVSSSSPTNSVLIDIRVTGPDPDQAAAIANSAGGNFAEVVTTVLERPTDGGASPVQISAIEEATSPPTPVSPNTTRNLALGFVLGLVVGLGLAALRSALDTRIANPKDLAHLTDVPTLGAILDDPRADKHALVVHSNPRSPRSESFRSLRTNLQFVNVDGNPRSFVVTSSAPNEGKTTVSTNLAISLAQTGASVVLVDADLRKPSVAKVMGVDGSIGLSSVLAGLVELEDVLTPWVGGGLHVVPAGRIPPNPSELLGSVEMANLLSRLTDRFDHVIIDTPPVLAVTDAALLSRLAGGTILVAAVGLARRNDVVAALDALDGIARRLSGIVVTRAPSKGPDAYHYARYVYVDDDAARLGTDSLAWLEDGTERQRRRVR